jgi:hypothetical protein
MVDALPLEARQQLFDAYVNKTHSVPAMISWLVAEYGEEAEGISDSMLRQWLNRRKHFGVA